MATLRGYQQPELSKKLFKLIKSENHAIGAHETAGRERIAIASQLSDWGEATGDEAVSDVSDKLGVLLSELGEQEDGYAQNLEDYRAVLKQIRNTEGSVQPSREAKAKIADEIQKLKLKEPESTRIVQLEQELVRAEAQNLVAEAQLTNVVRLLPPTLSPLSCCRHHHLPRVGPTSQAHATDKTRGSLLTPFPRHARRSRKPTTSTSPPSSSGPRSRPSWRATAGAC